MHGLVGKYKKILVKKVMKVNEAKKKKKKNLFEVLYEN